MTIKFGKLKITADYQLRTSSNFATERILNWGFSPYKVDITNEINFGCELKTCVTPFNPLHPAQLINVKFEKLVLSISNTVL